ncbi:hypothetical protein KR222_001551 [Zaprionus bogoriensis]|nr:hypothetical protein KR222_001551 [Zaprionus bogoriensis]
MIMTGIRLYWPMALAAVLLLLIHTCNAQFESSSASDRGSPLSSRIIRQLPPEEYQEERWPGWGHRGRPRNRRRGGHRRHNRPHSTGWQDESSSREWADNSRPPPSGWGRGNGRHDWGRNGPPSRGGGHRGRPPPREWGHRHGPPPPEWMDENQPPLHWRDRHRPPPPPSEWDHKMGPPPRRPPPPEWEDDDYEDDSDEMPAPQSPMNPSSPNSNDNGSTMPKTPLPNQPPTISPTPPSNSGDTLIIGTNRPPLFPSTPVPPLAIKPYELSRLRQIIFPNSLQYLHNVGEEKLSELIDVRRR